MQGKALHLTIRFAESIVSYFRQKIKCERIDTMDRTTNSSPLRMRTIAEAAKETGVPQHALRRWVKSGQIPAVYSGNRALLNLDRLIGYLQGGASVEK